MALNLCASSVSTDTRYAIRWLRKQYRENGGWHADWFVPPPYAVTEIAKAVGHGSIEAQDAIRELINQQQEDGGWLSLPDSTSSAAATGTAVAALVAFATPHDAPILRGIDFLMRTQTDRGDWPLSPLVSGPRPLVCAETINNVCLAAMGLASVNV